MFFCGFSGCFWVLVVDCGVEIIAFDKWVRGKFMYLSFVVLVGDFIRFYYCLGGLVGSVVLATSFSVWYIWFDGVCVLLCCCAGFL